jgi:hypothetical protein
MQTITSILKSIISREETRINPLDSFPNFTNYRYEIAVKPIDSKGPAWDKLMECERHLEMYRWVEKLNDPAKAQHRILLDDTVSCFLLSLEATLKFLDEKFDDIKKKQINIKFEEWLTKQPEYNVHIRGLRALRHFAAHIEIKHAPSKVVVVNKEISSRTWTLPRLTESDNEKLYPSSRLSPSYLSEWNALIERSNIEGIFKEALLRLNKILEAFELIL